MGRVSFCGVLTGNRPAGHKQHIRAGHVGKGRADAQVHQVDMVVDHTGVSAQRTVCAPGRYARISLGPMASSAVNPGTELAR